MHPQSQSQPEPEPEPDSRPGDDPHPAAPDAHTRAETGAVEDGDKLVVISLSDSDSHAKTEDGKGSNFNTQEEGEGEGDVHGKRQRWNNRAQFIFTCVGYAVGIGNIWRFPYLTYRFGGGAFLIPYLLALFVLGIPLFVLELAIGQHFQTSVVRLFTILHGRFRGVGFATVITVFLVGGYYTILLAWSLLFLIRCFASEVPWGSDPAKFFYTGVLNGAGQGKAACWQCVDIKLRHFATLTSSIIQGWLVLTLFASIFLVFLSVRHGVRSSGRASMVLVTVPYIFLIVLFFRAVTLEGADLGIRYYLYPDWSKMLDLDIWVQATSQIFFSLGPGFGMIIAFGSFLPPKEDIVKDSFIISVTNSATSIFAGFVVFGVLGHFAHIRGVGVDQVARAGPELAFIVYPESLGLLPGSVFFSIAFFTMLFFLGASSEVAWNVALISILHEELKALSGKYPILSKLKKTHVTIATLSLDHFVPQFILMAISLLECIAVGWVYGADRLRHEMHAKSGVRLGKVWSRMWRYVLPILLSLLLVMEFIQEFSTPFAGYPDWAVGLGWAMSFLCALPIIPYAFGCMRVSPSLYGTGTEADQAAHTTRHTRLDSEGEGENEVEIEMRAV